MTLARTAIRLSLVPQLIVLMGLLLGCGASPPAEDAAVALADTDPDSMVLPAGATIADGADTGDAEPDANDAADQFPQDTADAADIAPSIPPVVDLGPPYALSGFGCALPDPPSPSAECAIKVCPEGQGCMGAGHCHPLVPTLLDDPPGGALNPSVAVNGDFWGIAYSTRAPDQNSLNLQVRIFGEDGAAVGDPLSLTNETTVWHQSPQLFSTGEHGWLVSWIAQDLLTDFETLRIRPIAQDGTASGAEIVIAQQVYEWPSNVRGARFAKLPVEGTAIAVWAGSTQGDKQAVYSQPLNLDGKMLAAPIKLSKPNDKAYSASVAPLPDGALVVWASWLDFYKPNPIRVIARKLRPDGVPAAPEFQLPAFGKPYEGQPSVVGFPDGSAFVARALGKIQTISCPVDYDGLLLAQSAPTAIIKELPKFGYDTSSTMFQAPMAAHFPGRAVVVWHDYGTGGSIYLRHYYRNINAMDCDATDVAAPNVANASTYYSGPSVATFDDGRVLVAWSTQTKDATGLQTMRTVVRFLPQ
ncbi:MAG: hypothetical protein HY902_12335 [Deltaproteobacteria bacterium]|nr:hypothetical protein [Deltaproteobacteria bacterium]